MAVFDSLHDVPLDEYQGDDGDDSLIPSGQVNHEPPPVRALASAAAPPDPHVVVPYFYLKRNARGLAVLALVRALSVAGYGKWKGKLFSRTLGVFAERNLNKFKAKHGLPQNGVYDRATHTQLAKFYDDYAIKHLLVAQVAKPTKEQKQRAAFIAQLMYLYNRRAYEQYTQRRAWDQHKPPAGLDCSASGEWAAEHSGLRSLSGYSGFGFGNTDSQLSRYRHLDGVRAGIASAQPGDPVYYGRGGDPSHVAFYLGDGRVWSFGAYPIKILAADYRHDRIAICNLMAGQ